MSCSFFFIFRRTICAPNNNTLKNPCLPLAKHWCKFLRIYIKHSHIRGPFQGRGGGGGGYGVACQKFKKSYVSPFLVLYSELYVTVGNSVIQLLFFAIFGPLHLLEFTLLKWVWTRQENPVQKQKVKIPATKHDWICVKNSLKPVRGNSFDSNMGKLNTNM